MAMDPDRIADIIEIEQLLARYAVGMTKDDVEAVMDVFTSDGTYSAFGDTYSLADFPELVAAAPKGVFLTGPAALVVDGDTGTGEQPFQSLESRLIIIRRVVGCLFFCAPELLAECLRPLR